MRADDHIYMDHREWIMLIQKKAVRKGGRTVIGLEFNFFKLSFPFYNSLVFFN